MILKNTFFSVFFSCLVSLFFLSCASSKSASPPPDLGAKFKTVQEAAANTKKESDSFKKRSKDSNLLSTKTTDKTQKDHSSSFAHLSGASNIPPPQSTDELPVYGSWLDRLMGKVLDVESTVEARANQNFPIVLNLVFVKDPATYTSLRTITTRNWFKRDQQEVEALKKQKDLLEIREITVLPEQKTYSYLVRAPSHTKAGLLFVRLIENDNLYPTLFNPYEDLFLTFSSNDFTLEQYLDADKG